MSLSRETSSIRRRLQAGVRCLLALGLWSAGASAVQAQAIEEAPSPAAAQDDSERRARMFQNVGRLLQSFRTLGDWDQHSSYILDATERTYQRQGWNSESDHFSLDLIRSVESLPPWAVQDRFDTMVGMLSDRYMLDEEQERTLRGVMARTSNDIFRAHSERILTYASEAIQARASGEAFTPEMVARWSTLAEPVFLDMRKRLNENAQILASQLDPHQRELLMADLTAANNRLNRVEELGREWKAGKWSPADWGMEADPIQVAAESRNAAEAAKEIANAGVDGPVSGGLPEPGHEEPVVVDGGNAGEPPDVGQPPTGGVQQNAPDKPQSRRPPRVAAGPGNSDPWSAYVDAFIKKYQLNSEQSDRAWQIYGDVRTRRDELAQRYERRRRPVHQGVSEPITGDVDAQRDAMFARLFEQMARRLDRLPTRAQRKDAGPQPLPQVIAKPAKPAAAPAGADKPGR
jgi:hypothetical protein